MANASIIKVSSQNLDSVPVKDGQIIFVIDTQKIYFDYSNARKLYSGTGGTVSTNSYANTCQGDTAYWTTRKDDIFPNGYVLINNESGKMWVSNGLLSVNDSKDLWENYLQTAAKVANKLYWGTVEEPEKYVYDGSETVHITIYNGE